MTAQLLNQYAMSFVGLPYRWGGDEPSRGFDCSGFIQELLMAAGIDPPGDQSADQLYRYFLTAGAPVPWPGVGTLAFFGSTKLITHVAWCLDSVTMIEAGGGNSKVIDLDSASSAKAFIRLRPITHRKDSVGFIRVINP